MKLKFEWGDFAINIEAIPKASESVKTKVKMFSQASGVLIVFIEGSEKIKAQIDALSDIRNSDTIFWADLKIEELEQQLKKLSNTCTCGRREINTLSGICDECWNEMYPDEKVELKD